MGASAARKARRAALGVTGGGGGYGLNNIASRPATGQGPSVNPFMLPKQTGLTNTTQMFPNMYFREWDLTSWRLACDQAQKMGYPISYAVLTSWCYESSVFIQSLFKALGDAVESIPFYLTDDKGNKDEVWSKEICGKRWFKLLIREILFSYFWGFSGINFDPIGNKVYKYEMQNIDPINRMLRQSTFNFSDGVSFYDCDNLLFVQPSTSYESFLGWMQPITRMYIQMNMNTLNWVQAGRRLAFPLFVVKYPANSNSLDSESNQGNPYRDEADMLASGIDPSKALVTPYVIDANGNMQTAIEAEFKDTATRAQMHKIFQEFNSDAKNEIRELIFGGTLTSDAGKFGTKGLGEVHEGKLEKAIQSNVEFILTVLNDETDFLRKIKRFYRNFPENRTFDINRSKSYDITEIESLAKSMQTAGLKLTPKFFVKYGLDEEDIEEAPKPETPMPSIDHLSVKLHEPSFFDSKKKFLFWDENTQSSR